MAEPEAQLLRAVGLIGEGRGAGPGSRAGAGVVPGPSEAAGPGGACCRAEPSTNSAQVSEIRGFRGPCCEIRNGENHK